VLLSPLAFLHRNRCLASLPRISGPYCAAEPS